MRGQRMERRDLTVAEAAEVLRALETEKLLSAEAIVKEAIQVRPWVDWEPLHAPAQPPGMPPGLRAFCAAWHVVRGSQPSVQPGMSSGVPVFRAMHACRGAASLAWHGLLAARQDGARVTRLLLSGRAQASIGPLLAPSTGVWMQVTESDGIVFLDEIDKIVSNSDLRHGADASAEGVQRDLLPIIEGR